MSDFVYTIWKKEGTQKPKQVDSFTSKSLADSSWKQNLKNSSNGVAFRMQKNKINSLTHGKIIRKKESSYTKHKYATVKNIPVFIMRTDKKNSIVQNLYSGDVISVVNNIVKNVSNTYPQEKMNKYRLKKFGRIF